VLERGYSLTRAADGRLVASVAALAPGEKVTVTLRDGEVAARVEELHPRKGGNE
jgi:exonuclease VII large subunit